MSLMPRDPAHLALQKAPPSLDETFSSTPTFSPSPYRRHRPPSTRPFPQHQPSHPRPLASVHLALQHGMSLTLLPSTSAIADIDSLNAFSLKPDILHSTPGIFYGSNTTRTSLKRATALDARRSVSEICLRGGCRCRWQRATWLHSTPGIFFGSNTTRTSLSRATALDARQSVSEICLRGGCRPCRQRSTMSEGA